MSAPENYPGQRLSFSGALCTVHYVGAVESTKGDWLGVEWDEPSRGKHDGSHKGVRYFQCRSASSTAASFIRPSRPNDQPSSFLEALKKKYASTSAEEITATAKEIHISGKTVEEVGFEKIRRQLAELQELRVVVLDGACIAAVDSDLGKQNLKIIELDLSRNLLESWYEVTAICRSLRSLQSLRLDGNTLSQPQDPFKDDEPQGPYGRLKELSLNNVGFCHPKMTGKDGNLTWEFIRNLTAMFTSLTTLSLASNNLTNITLPLSTSLLTKIELSSNAITTLEHIRPLTALPILQTLSLRANPLTSLSTPPDELVVFPKLKHLDLKSTLLPTLSSLNPISLSFPELQSLLTNHTPLTTYPSASLHTIARLATLTELNYSQITSPERQNAELYYLNQISKQLAAAVDNTEEHEILKENPRWNELCDIHGSPTTISPRPTETAGAGTLAARVTAFTFHISTQDLQTARKHAQGITGHSINETVEKEDDLETPIEIERNNIPFNHHAPPSIEKKKLIPRTVDVYRLKGIVGHLFAIRPLSIKLVWETDEWDPVGEGDGGWSVSEDDESVDEDDESDNEDDGSNDDDNDGSNDDDNDEKKSIANTEGKKNTEKKMGLWKRRELELVDGTREVGFFVEGKEARVRVEAR